MEQRTLEWQRARLGKFTGSSVGKLMVTARGGKGFGKTALSYLYGVAYERALDDNIVDSDDEFDQWVWRNNPTSRAMEWGTENEPLARQEYITNTWHPVVECGSITHPEVPCFASSPDGLVDNDGCLEIKCLGKSTLMAYRHECKDADGLKSLNPEYYWQCMAHMAVTGRSWCDFVIFNPEVGEQYRLLVVRINRDEEAIATLLERVKEADKLVVELAGDYVARG